MKTSSALVRYPGDPLSVMGLLPDRCAAAVAACLLAGGHDTEIIDLGTAEGMAELFQARPLRDLMKRRNGSPAALAADLPDYRKKRAWRRAFRASRSIRCLDVARDLAYRQLDFVGFCVHKPADIAPAAEIAGQLRNLNSNVRLLIFGKAAETFAPLIAACGNVFDALCYYDPEWAIVHWAESICRPDQWSTIPNVAAIGDSRDHLNAPQPVDIADVPKPAYAPGVYPALANGSGKIRVFPIEMERGCGAGCHCCPGQSAARRKPLPLVSKELAALQEYNRARAFLFEQWTADTRALTQLSRLIMNAHPGLVYSNCQHGASFGAQALPLLKASGCLSLGFHIDSGSQRLQEDYFGREVSISRLEELVRLSGETGFFTSVRMLYPTPADDWHTEAESLRFLRRAKPHGYALEAPSVHPFSEWRRHNNAFGFAAEKVNARAWRVLLANLDSRFAKSRADRKTRETLEHEICCLNGMSTLSEEEFLIACLADHAAAPQRAIDALRHSLSTGDSEFATAFVAKVNDNACLREDPLFSTGTRLREAVGN